VVCARSSNISFHTCTDARPFARRAVNLTDNTPTNTIAFYREGLGPLPTKTKHNAWLETLNYKQQQDVQMRTTTASLPPPVQRRHRRQSHLATLPPPPCARVHRRHRRLNLATLILVVLLLLNTQPTEAFNNRKCVFQTLSPPSGQPLVERSFTTFTETQLNIVISDSTTPSSYTGTLAAGATLSVDIIAPLSKTVVACTNQVGTGCFFLLFFVVRSWCFLFCLLLSVATFSVDIISPLSKTVVACTNQVSVCCCPVVLQYDRGCVVLSTFGCSVFVFMF
jgi:hypothetical protein